MTQARKIIGKTAVVIGGSMAGLLAARVLSDYYSEVIILEQDIIPLAGEQRKGVPQGRHAHALLARGRMILEELFPGLTEHLVEVGAPLGRGRFHSGGGYFCLPQDGPKTLLVSRPCLEAEVRTRLLARTNVRLVENVRVFGLTASDDHQRVSGVRLSLEQSDDEQESIPADLVVDASGRGSRTPAWLEELGYARPTVDLVEVKMGYTSRFYRREAHHLNGDMLINIAPTSANKRTCGLMA
jgi:2-polyprenyl-6-methoxyphenol hydroxylase-like FAD-dependent oxidoreductase